MDTIDMAGKLNPSELVSFKELLIANSIEVDALALLLIDEGIISKEKFFAKLKEVQIQYQVKKSRVQISSDKSPKPQFGDTGKKAQLDIIEKQR